VQGIELCNFRDHIEEIPNMSSLVRFPSYFFSHGGPNMILNKKDVTVQFLQNLGKEILQRGRPKGIVMVSAHWEAAKFKVTTGSRTLETIYDFSGFEDELYQLKYPAKTDPELANLILQLLKDAKLDYSSEEDRGLDHGAWTVLKIMFPEADIPVVGVSLKRTLDPEEHIALGKALAPLRDKGYLFIASGGETHNLSELFGRTQTTNDNAHQQFVAWTEDTLIKHEGNERNQLMAGFPKHPAASRAHPRTEHFMPLVVATGFGGKARKIYNQWFSTLSLGAYVFE